MPGLSPRQIVTAVAPAALCCWSNVVRSTSYQWPVVPVTMPAPWTTLSDGSRVFHVTDDSFHVVFEDMRTWNASAGDAVLSSLPNSRSFADEIVAN
jgi:hypothetical protein